nr:DUF4835 family protein [uncultured Flavobacterium sp.]
MRKFFSVVLLVLASKISFAQELNCTVQVDFKQITNANTQIFRTLQTQLNEFMNTTKWTSKNFGKNELIDCSFFIIINSFDGNNLSCSLQIQSSRPGFNSNYNSPILNFNDREFVFSYIENQQLVFNRDVYTSELLSTLAFYANLIIGLDADTYAYKGGDEFLQAAQNIVNTAQSSGGVAWTQGDNKQNRYYLITDLLTSTFEPYRKTLFDYHFIGIDKMVSEQKEAKTNIKNAIINLNAINRVRPNAFITRLFFDAKANEIVNIFSGGPHVETVDLKESLIRLSPLNNTKWNSIK